jgi:hypothetical protein
MRSKDQHQNACPMPLMKDQALKRLRKKAKRGQRSWPVGTVAFYGPDLDRATKVAAAIVPAEGAEASEVRSWTTAEGDIRKDPAIAEAILDFLAEHNALTVVIADGIIGCPHQEGIDYEGEWCPDPACAFWHGRDRWTGVKPA